MLQDSIVTKLAAACGVLLLLVGLSYVPEVIQKSNLADRLMAAITVSTTEYPFQDANIAVSKPQKTTWVRAGTAADGCRDARCSTDTTRDGRTWQNGRYTFTILNKGDEAVELFYKKTNIGVGNNFGNNNFLFIETNAPSLVKYKTTSSKAGQSSTNKNWGWEIMPDNSIFGKNSYLYKNERIILEPGEKTTITYEYEVNLKNAGVNKSYHFAISGLAYATEQAGSLSLPRENILDFKPDLTTSWSPWVVQMSIGLGARPLQDDKTFLEIVGVKKLPDNSGAEVSFRVSDPDGKLTSIEPHLIWVDESNNPEVDLISSNYYPIAVNDDYVPGTSYLSFLEPLPTNETIIKKVVRWEYFGMPVSSPELTNYRLAVGSRRYSNELPLSVYSSKDSLPRGGVMEQKIDLSDGSYLFNIGLTMMSAWPANSCGWHTPFGGGDFPLRPTQTIDIPIYDVPNKSVWITGVGCTPGRLMFDGLNPQMRDYIVTTYTHSEKPTIQITQPSAPEIWYFGQTKEIKWTSAGLSAGNIDISLKYSDSRVCNLASVPYSQNSAQVKIEEGKECGAWNLQSGEYEIVLYAGNGNPDVPFEARSEGPEIGLVSIKVLTPNGGESLPIGSDASFSFTSPSSLSAVVGDLWLPEIGWGLYRNGVLLGYPKVGTEETNENGVHKFTWKAGHYRDAITDTDKIAPAGGGYKMGVYVHMTGLVDESDAVFSLVEPNVSIEVSNPVPETYVYNGDNGVKSASLGVQYDIKAIGGDVYIPVFMSDSSENPRRFLSAAQLSVNNVPVSQQNIPFKLSSWSSTNGYPGFADVEFIHNNDGGQWVYKIPSGKTARLVFGIYVSPEWIKFDTKNGNCRYHAMRLYDLAYGSNPDNLNKKYIFPRTGWGTSPLFLKGSETDCNNPVNSNWVESTTKNIVSSSFDSCVSGLTGQVSYIDPSGQASVKTCQ